MANPNMLVVLGTSPDSYFLGYGRRLFVEGMPEAFAAHARDKLHIAMTTWISMNPALDTWVDFNVQTNEFHFNADIGQDIRDHLSGVNGKAAAEFITFSDDPDPARFFLKGKQHAWWTAKLNDTLIQGIVAQQKSITGFDGAVTGVLFGKGNTFITMLSGGFVGSLDGEARAADHALNKVLSEFSKGWCIERGSTLCFYDSAYFFLKFKQPGGSTIQMRWNLPPNMATRLTELQEIAKTPEEQQLLLIEDQRALQLAQMRMNMEMGAYNGMANLMTRGAANIAAAASGGYVVERRW
ncbi:hypothetical protein DFH07DRAFT_803963 [Mycena maculata]|uniref:Uncharacterized protein n=1 Tax=Mycena maculata TaxID=230809 RepID=A0AAD7NQI9_9AGAR|nr:hypothetical protein DFH07DRAFT_803963 [Mycena maculata]